MNSLVTVAIVTHNSRRFIEKCLAAVLEQDYRPFEVVIVDNSSTDGSAETLTRFKRAATVIRNPTNIGFAAGQNQAIHAARGEWVLTLNPDVLLEPDFLTRLLACRTLDPKTGVICGKLLRADPDLTIPADRRFDSAGIYFTPTARHFDRGWNEADDGRYDEREYVFGATAAAALYRREMLADIALGADFFDSDFFVYREDADLAWRAQLMGWRCIYTPDAVGYHVRQVVPGPRNGVPSVLRMHSVKNRFLMRVNNMTAGLYRRLWLPTTLRDGLVIGGCLLSEPGSLPAFWHLAKSLGRAWGRRREIMSRRRVTDEYVASWFSEEPASRPVREGSAAPAVRAYGLGSLGRQAHPAPAAIPSARVSRFAP